VFVGIVATGPVRQLGWLQTSPTPSSAMSYKRSVEARREYAALGLAQLRCARAALDGRQNRLYVQNMSGYLLATLGLVGIVAMTALLSRSLDTYVQRLQQRQQPDRPDATTAHSEL